MTVPALTFVTYLWHYLLARALYDHLGLAVVPLAVLALAIVALRGRRR